MDTGGEVVLFALGVLCAVSFLLCIFGACIGRDTNWQESFERSENIAYVGSDDLWYPGVRLKRSYNASGWWHWIRGRSYVETVEGGRFWMPSHGIIELDNIFRPKRLTSIFPRHRKKTNVEDGTAPVAGNLMRAYTPVWTFIINNVIIALSTAVGFEVRLSSTVSQIVGFFIIFGTTFLSGFIIMLVFFYFFGFGEAMLAPRRPKVLSPLLVEKLFRGKIEINSGEAVIVSETNNIYGPRLNFNYVSKIYLEQPEHIVVQTKRHRDAPR